MKSEDYVSEAINNQPYIDPLKRTPKTKIPLSTILPPAHPAAVCTGRECTMQILLTGFLKS